MTSKIIVNTIEADTGISSVTFASNINLQNDSSVLVSSSGVTLGTGSTIAAPSANEITLSTNSAERLRIDSAGRLGLGANNNSSYDAISQNFLIANESSHAGMTIRSGGSGAFGAIHFADGVSDNSEKRAGRILYGHTGDFMSFHTANTERLRITDAGMVGINMTPSTVGSSTYMLQMYNAGSQCFMSLGQGSGNGPLNGLVLGVSNAAHYITGRENRPMIFATNDTERLRIGSDGHLSYKNSSPPSWSTDSGYANVTLGSSAYFRTDTDVNSNFFSLGSNAYRSSSGWQHVNSGWATQLQQSANDGDLSYRSSSTSGSADGTISWVEHFRVTSSGDVGIGENSPADRLVVQEINASGDVAVRIKNDTLTDGSASTPTTASLYLNTSTGNFNTFYIQARRYDNDTHFGYSNPRDGGHTPNMIISNEGRITKPNQPCAMAYNAQGQHMAGNAIAQFNSTRFNIGNMYNSSNGRMTVPVDGRYLVAYSGLHDYVSQNAIGFDIRINGSNFNGGEGYQECTSSSNSQLSKTLILNLSANDYVQIFIRQSGTQVHQRYGSFSMCLIT